MAGAKEKVVHMPIDEIWPNPCSEDATRESMQQALDDIKSIDHWSSTFGQLQGHNITMIETFCRLITEGVKRWRFDFDWKDIVALSPTATSGTWWIMLYSENHTDEKLCSKLAVFAKYLHPYVWRANTCQRMACRFLILTAHQISRAGVQETHQQLAAFKAYAAGRGRIDG